MHIFFQGNNNTRQLISERNNYVKKPYDLFR